jgi:hypothetical protein
MIEIYSLITTVAASLVPGDLVKASYGTVGWCSNAARMIEKDSDLDLTVGHVIIDYPYHGVLVTVNKKRSFALVMFQDWGLRWVRLARLQPL